MSVRLFWRLGAIIAVMMMPVLAIAFATVPVLQWRVQVVGLKLAGHPLEIAAWDMLC